MTTAASVDDPRFVAAVDLVGRTGAKEFQVRWSDDEEPTVWIAVANYRDGHEAAAALHPLPAVLRLIEQLIDGGLCAHCRRPSAVSDDWQHEQPLDEVFCWYVFDPELRKYRRSCEGDDVTPVGRNEPCPCGSGKKFKQCHGSRR